MKKKGILIAIVVIVAVIAVVAIALISSYNGLIDKEEAINTARATISVQLQRRANLIPNFVSTVKGYSEYEKSTYTAVVEARSKVTMASGVQEQAKANAELNHAVDVWVNAVTEAYPELKADQQYIALQDELASTENRIAIARKDYNDAAQDYNKTVRRFPGSIAAGLFGFEQVEYFAADESAYNVPTVDFS